MQLCYAHHIDITATLLHFCHDISNSFTIFQQGFLSKHLKHFGELVQAHRKQSKSQHRCRWLNMLQSYRVSLPFKGDPTRQCYADLVQSGVLRRQRT